MDCRTKHFGNEKKRILFSNILEMLLVNYKRRRFFAESEKIGVQYVVSIYWAVGTMCVVGYGDIRANLSKEVVFVI